MPLDTEPTCTVCHSPIYRRPNCVTCSARCSRILRAHKSLAGRPCAVCERPIPSRRKRAATCSNICARRLMAMRQQARGVRANSTVPTPTAPEVPVHLRELATMRMPHQRHGYAPRWPA